MAEQMIQIVAYDVSSLIAKLKLLGLDVAEESAHKVALEVFSWLKDSINASPSLLDNMLLLILPEVEKQLQAAIDKINGKIGG